MATQSRSGRRSSSERSSRKPLRLEPLGWALMALNLGIHLLAMNRFGLHRDEFLYAEMGRHIAQGYKETAPLIGLVSGLGQLLFGKTMFALRFFPALFSTATLGLCLALVTRFGGGRLAVAVCAAAYICSPVELAFGHLFQPNFLEQFCWMAAAAALVLAMEKPDPGRAVLLVLLLGLGLWAKFSILYYGACLLVGLLADARGRTVLGQAIRYGWWMGLVLAAPLVAWQAMHNWPFLAHMRMLNDTQLVHGTLPQFLLGQLLIHFPALPVWAAGLYAALAGGRLKAFRPLAYQWLLLMVFLAFTGGKNYYGASAYLPLFVAGSVFLEEVLWRRLWLAIVPAATLLAGLVLVPLVLPVLGREDFIRYAAWARRQPGLEAAFRWEDGRMHDMPQDYADELGWQELAPLVEQAMSSLPEGGRHRSLVVGDGYGQAGAANWYQADGAGWRAISTNGSFSLWNAVPDSVTSLVYLNEGDLPVDLYPFFGRHRIVGRVQDPLARISGAEVILMEDPRPGAIAYLRRRIEEARAGFE